VIDACAAGDQSFIHSNNQTIKQSNNQTIKQSNIVIFFGTLFYGAVFLLSLSSIGRLAPTYRCFCLPALSEGADYMPYSSEFKPERMRRTFVFALPHCRQEAR
jgi:hypothetical protein